MKKIMFLSISVLFVFFMTNDVQAQTSDKTTEEVVLQCEMKCGDCAAKVKKQLAFTKGVKAVTPDYETDEVHVKYRADKTNPQKLAQSLDKIGYKASVKNDKTKADCDKKKPCKKDRKKGCCAKD